MQQYKQQEIILLRFRFRLHLHLLSPRSPASTSTSTSRPHHIRRSLYEASTNIPGGAPTARRGAISATRRAGMMSTTSHTDLSTTSPRRAISVAMQAVVRCQWTRRIQRIVDIDIRQKRRVCVRVSLKNRISLRRGARRRSREYRRRRDKGSALFRSDFPRFVDAFCLGFEAQDYELLVLGGENGTDGIVRGDVRAGVDV
jgi:hypothetical protein